VPLLSPTANPGGPKVSHRYRSHLRHGYRDFTSGLNPILGRYWVVPGHAQGTAFRPARYFGG
jgi:hypothetical protein